VIVDSRWALHLVEFGEPTDGAEIGDGVRVSISKS
jgi:hypothetical protein